MNNPKRQDIAVYIGRFQPFHLGHLSLLQQALSLAAEVVVVIGSAHQARTPRNPFTWQERARMIELALPAEDAARVHFLPVRDHYDDTRWQQAVRRGVGRIAQARFADRRAAVTLVGHLKDATSAYLQQFEGWTLHATERAGAVDGSHIRDAFLGAPLASLEATLAALHTAAPASTLDFLRAWAALPFHAELAREWHMLRAYKAAWATAPYPPVFVTVDAVVTCAGHVLLIQRGQPPGVGLWAVPGGFIEQRETALQSALRELREETRLGLLESSMRQCLRASAVFDHPDRSLRGRTITHAFHFDLGDRALPEVAADDDAQAARWVPIGSLRQMEDRFHDDHFHMLDHFLGLLRDEDLA
jgi:bifunctional NMN adenylyltransferase/nudix hydrolase